MGANCFLNMIYDQHGNQMIASRKFAAPAVNDAQERPWEAIRLADIDKLIPKNDQRTLVYVSRRLYQNMGPVRAAIDQRAMYSVGRAWRPKFVGQATEWGKRAKEWLEEKWFPTCDVRGPNHDWQTGLYLDSVHVDRDGDIGCLYTKTESGWPQLQRIPAHRIGNRSNDKDVGENDRLIGGPYKGLRISNGVVLNELDRPVAYKILGDNSEGKDDRYVSARDMDFMYDPQWHEQNRGMPLFVHALNDWRDMLQSLDWERQAQLIMSAIGLIEYNEDGMVDTSDPATMFAKPSDGGAASGGLSVKTMQGGLIRYMKSGSGAKLEAMKMDRPGEVWENFWDRGIRSALAGANWPYSLVWKPTGQGTAERVELQKADRSVMDRQDLLEPIARRRIGWAISVAINNGELSAYPGQDHGGFLKWEFTKPAKISIDLGRDANAQIEAWRAGFRNQATILEEQGRDLETVLFERAREIGRRKQIAAEVSSEMGVEIEDVEMSMIAQQQVPQTVNQSNDNTDPNQ